MRENVREMDGTVVEIEGFLWGFLGEQIPGLDFGFWIVEEGEKP